MSNLSGQTVILVDDGLATGSTMRAAASAIRQLEPTWIVGAVPVGSAEVCESMRGVVDEMICAETPKPFRAVGLWYDEFESTSDQEVCDLLRLAQERAARRPTAATHLGASAIDVVRVGSIPLTGGEHDYDRLLDLAGDAQFVLIGEATHGTAEFYRERARITRRLIEERGFSALVVEADWPDAYRVNRFVRGGSGFNAADALSDFHRFPRWMWRNVEVRDFIGWLRARNDGAPAGAVKVGFYGMDLYSLGASVEAVIGYLEKVDPPGALRARARYACFDQFGDDPQEYGAATVLGSAETCENEAVGQLVELQRRAGEPANRDGRVDKDEFFFAEQNARLAKNAEAYYRAMFRGRIPSWNLRDRHMAETLDTLKSYFQRRDGSAKLVVWAHNSHLGDARATEMRASGELNVGQLMRERHGRDVFSIGFSTYEGTVTAAHDWDGAAQRRRVRPQDAAVELAPVSLRRLVVPLDGSELAARALPVAEKLARRLGLPVVLVRVVDMAEVLGPFSDGLVIPPLLLEDVETEARQSLETAAATLRATGVLVITEVWTGAVFNAIAEASQPGDIIVLASHGRRGVTRWLLGSVAEKLVRDGPVPVIIVPSARG